MKLLVAVALAGSGLLTLAACSGGEESALPAGEVALEVVPTAVPRTVERPAPIGTVTEIAVLSEGSPPTALESTDVVGQPATEEAPEAQTDLGPWPRPDVDHAELPDIALLVQPHTWAYVHTQEGGIEVVGDGGPASRLDRISRSVVGEIIRETLMTRDGFIAEFPEFLSDSNYPLVDFVVAPDRSCIFAVVCHYGCEFVVGHPGRTSLFESRDGGVTWHHIATSPQGEPGWRVERVLPEGIEGEEGFQLIISGGRGEDGSLYYMLQPSGKVLPWPELPMGYEIHRPLLREGEFYWTAYRRPGSDDSKPEYILLTDDGAVLQPKPPRGYEIRRPFLQDGQIIWILHRSSGLDDSKPEYILLTDDGQLLPWPEPYEDATWPWAGQAGEEPTYVDPETGVERILLIPPYLVPPDVGGPDPRLSGRASYSGQRLGLVNLRHGPFLRVTGTGGCLHLKAEPSLGAEELTCAANGVLLKDLGYVEEVEETTWRRAMMPDGTDGWADARFLQ